MIKIIFYGNFILFLLNVLLLTCNDTWNFTLFYNLALINPCMYQHSVNINHVEPCDNLTYLLTNEQ